MSTTEDVVEGTTAPLDFQLLADGAIPTSGAMPGTPVLILHDRNGTLATTTGDVSVISAPLWTVRFTPDAADLSAAKSPYTMHFEVTDLLAQKSYWPKGAAYTLRVFKQ